MFAQFKNRQHLVCIPFMTITTFTFTSLHVFPEEQERSTPTQSRVENANQQASEQAPPERQTNIALRDRADDETPALGVLMGPCPGKAVCVKDVLPEGPASEAGIEPGDYILSLDGEEVTSPTALKKLIDVKKPEDEVTVKIWRQGEEKKLKVQLASKADQLPKGHDAWLGVILANGERGDIKIDHIVPDSPAYDSELEEGDILVKVGNKKIQDARDLVEIIEEMGPGDELELMIRRDNEERTIAIPLGSFSDAPMAFHRQLLSDDEFPMRSGSRGTLTSIQLIDRALDDMRRQIRVLREEIRELKGDKAVEPAKPSKAKQDEVSKETFLNGGKLVSQIQVQVPRRVYPRSGLSRRSYPYSNNYSSPYNQRYSSYYGGYSGLPYGGNNYYYRYGGRPYYYGGNSNWYGNRPRAGIRIGPNAGVYWY